MVGFTSLSVIVKVSTVIKLNLSSINRLLLEEKKILNHNTCYQIGNPSTKETLDISLSKYERVSLGQNNIFRFIYCVI